MSNLTTKVMNMEESIELFQLELTRTQLKALSGLLPQGFSLEPVSKHKSSISSNPTKKIFTNDKKPVASKGAKQINTPSPNTLAAHKPGLRDPSKRKPSTQFEFPDHETSQAANKSFKSNTPMFRKAQTLLQKLKKHPSAGPFLFPVDAKALGLHDYFDVVREPMDLGTVERKLKNGLYLALSEYAADIRKIWNNSLSYNMEGSAIYIMTLEMRSYFERLFNDIDNIQSNDAVRNLEKKVEMLTRQLSELHQNDFAVASVPTLQMSRSISKSSSKSNRNAKLMEKALTPQEKKTLGQNIQRLSPEHLRGVWEIVSQSLPPSKTAQEELEIDLESLPTRVSRELERFVKNKLSLMNRGKNKGKAKEAANPVQGGLYKQQEGYFEGVSKGEDEVTTQHHSINGSDGVPDFREGMHAKEDDILSNSSGSSFISDSDSEGDENRDMLNYNEGKGRGKLLTANTGFGFNSLIGN